MIDIHAHMPTGGKNRTRAMVNDMSEKSSKVNRAFKPSGLVLSCFYP